MPNKTSRELLLNYALTRLAESTYEAGFTQRYLLENPGAPMLVANLNNAKAYAENAIQIIQMVLDTEVNPVA